MSVNSKLDDLIQTLSDHVDRIDESTKKIDDTTGRMKYVMSKTETLTKKCELPLSTFTQLNQLMKGVVDACSNFKMIEMADEEREATDDAATFERFTSIVEAQLERCEKEIEKLNALEDVTHRATEK